LRCEVQVPAMTGEGTRSLRIAAAAGASTSAMSAAKTACGSIIQSG
jgi:hypothetical protein